MTLTASLLERALDAGRALDLSDCVYGPPHWKGEFVAHGAPYYAFLAGLMRVLELERAFEVGTHYAGAAIALAKGVPEGRRGVVVTSDVTDLNRAGTDRYPAIVRVQGDSLAPRVVDRIVSCFDRHIDLLYVDTVHTYRATYENVAVYANRLKPRFIVLDDIRLNPDMRALWRDLGRLEPGTLLDVSELVEREDAGFGVIECRYPFTFPESPLLVREAWRGAFALRRAARAVLPQPLKDAARKTAHRVAAVLRRS